MTAAQGRPGPLDWWYVRAYPGSADALDAATRTLLPWLRDRARETGAERWFFLRYLDVTGHHLRLRVAGPPEALDQLHARRSELAGLLTGLPASTTAARLVPGSLIPTMTEIQGLRADLYGPELAKYGGPAGVELAERLFTRACRWYVEADIAGIAPVLGRAALARAYAARLITAALPENEQRRAFHVRHQRFWGPQLRALLPTRAAVVSRLAWARAGMDAALPPLWERFGSGVDEHVRAVVATLDAAAVVGVPVSRARLLLHYLHMDLNRWGFPPAEECLLVIAAGNEPAAARSLV